MRARESFCVDINTLSSMENLWEKNLTQAEERSLGEAKGGNVSRLLSSLNSNFDSNIFWKDTNFISNFINNIKVPHLFCQCVVFKRLLKTSPKKGGGLWKHTS